MTSLDFYNKCLDILLRIKPNNIDLEKYYIGDNKNFQTLTDVFYRLTVSARNYQSMPNVIGYEKKSQIIDKILYDYNHIEVNNNYSVDSLYQLFRKTFNITSADTKMNAWYKWSSSIIDSAKFISKFKDIDEFKKFIDCYSMNAFTRASLPMLIEKEIKGIGFALACDFLKELGYTEYCKPDVHIIDVLNAVDNTNYNPYQAFKRLVQIAIESDVTPYKLDKIIWLICSGRYYLDDIKIDSYKTDLINELIAS